jgi:signal transduction histidine kinase
VNKEDKGTILIVDDSLFNRKILEDNILSFGHYTKVAANGKEALEYLRTEKIDLILLDVMMPDIDGYELCVIIKNEVKLKEIPVIFITGKVDTVDIVKGFEVGGVDYITKPFNPLELKSRVKTHLDLKKSLDRVKAYNERLILVTENLSKANKIITNKKIELEESIKKLEDTQLQLIGKERVAGIGQLAAGVAHEINTPLGYIISNFDTMRKYISKFKELISLYKNIEILNNDARVEGIFEEIKAFEDRNHMDFISDDTIQLLKDTGIGLERVREIISALRSFSNIDQMAGISEYNFNKGIGNVLIIAEIEIMNYATVEKEFTDVPLVFASTSEINQVILNILYNAVYAIKAKLNISKGIISIKTYKEDNYVVCDIQDNGIGIENAIISKIFDPFFTTKPKEEAAGLGLSLAYEIIVEKHCGKLFVESELGVYSKFTIKLPINK